MPRCEFETASRTFLGKSSGPAQDLPLNCRRVAVSGDVRITYGEARRAVAEKLECRRTEEKGGHAVHCAIRHDRLGVGTTASCAYFESYCGDEHWPRMETDARALIVRIIELLEPLAGGATPAIDIDPTALPPTIDLNRLGGRAIPGKQFEACAFDDEPGSVTIGLRCGSSASGVVGIGDASGEAIPNPEPGIPDDIVVCSRGSRQSVCYLRHGTLQLSTTVDCPGPRRRPARDGCRHGASPSSLMARVAQLLATLP